MRISLALLDGHIGRLLEQREIPRDGSERRFGIVRQIGNELILAALSGNGGALFGVVFPLDVVNRFLGKRKLTRKLQRGAFVNEHRAQRNEQVVEIAQALANGKRHNHENARQKQRDRHGVFQGANVVVRRQIALHLLAARICHRFDARARIVVITHNHLGKVGIERSCGLVVERIDLLGLIVPIFRGRPQCVIHVGSLA